MLLLIRSQFYNIFTNIVSVIIYQKNCKKLYVYSQYQVLYVRSSEIADNLLYYCCSVAQLCPTLVTPWTAAHQTSLSFTVSWSLLKLMSIESVMPSNHLSSPSSAFFPSIRVFSNKSALHIRWPKYWSFSFSTSPSNEYSELTSFRIDWFDLLAVQGILKSILQHHSSKASILQCQPSLSFTSRIVKRC